MKKFIGFMACLLLMITVGAYETRACKAGEPPGVEHAAYGTEHYHVDMAFDLSSSVQVSDIALFILGEAEIVQTKATPEFPVAYMGQERCRSCENLTDNYDSPHLKPPIFHRDK